MALSLLINGAEQVDHLKDGTLRITLANGDREGRCDFTLLGARRALIQTVVVADGGTTYFDGTLRQVTTIAFPGARAEYAHTAQDAGATPAASVAPFCIAERSGPLTHRTAAEAGALAWWRLGESAGTDAVDEMAYRTGKYMNTPTLGATGALTTDPGTAVTFNGTDEYVDCGVAMLAGQVDFSIAAWFKTSSAALIQTIYAERNATTGNALIRLYINTDGRPVFQYRDNAGTLDGLGAASGDWSDGAWHHVAVTKDGTAGKLYVDGVSIVAETISTSDTLSGTIVARIGCDPRDGQFFPGSLQEVIISDLALDGGSVKDLFTTRNVQPYTALQVTDYWDAVASDDYRTAEFTTLTAGLKPGQAFGYNNPPSYGALWYTTIQEVSVRWLTLTPVWTVVTGDIIDTGASTSVPRFPKMLKRFALA